MNNMNRANMSREAVMVYYNIPLKTQQRGNYYNVIILWWNIEYVSSILYSSQKQRLLGSVLVLRFNRGPTHKQGSRDARLGGISIDGKARIGDMRQQCPVLALLGKKCVGAMNVWSNVRKRCSQHHHWPSLWSTCWTSFSFHPPCTSAFFLGN